ncbi:MAG: hypothetical protein NC548_45705, partial [Lachnospiraceae bacterium]|nr:hypothetical protein [Lachnospiraceae bacterium]
RGTKTETVEGTPQTSDAIISVDVGNLGSEIAALKALVGTLPEGADDVVSYAKDLADEAKDLAEEKVASVTAADASIDVGTDAKNPELKVNLHVAGEGEQANIAELKSDGIYVPAPTSADTYEVIKASDAGEFAAIYRLMRTPGGQGEAVAAGVDINIPKDMVVESGEIVEDPEGQDPGTYIKLVLQNVDEPLFINVGSLIEYVTGATAADGIITVDVDATTHVATATIGDGKITLAKLTVDVQAEIGKAHEHANADVLEGITEDQVTDWDDAADKAHEHTNKTELDKFEAGDKAKLDAAAEAAGTAVQTVQVNGTAVDANAEGEVNITAETGTSDGQIKIAGQDVAVKGLADAAYKTSEYFIGGADTSTKDDDTIKGAKAYADNAVTTALTWQEF